jgi:hypothetical protein
VILDQKENKAFRVYRVYKANKVKREIQVLKVNKVFRVKPVLGVKEVYMATLEYKEKGVRKGRRVILVLKV